jgi:peptidoglycan/xylan/chitin deacetylase (PgdA/CDA1 family)
VITFDDGYVDNFLFALPLLEKYKVPATIFVTTDYIGKDRELWWDELEKKFLGKSETGWDVTQPILNQKCEKYLNSHKKLKALGHKERSKISREARKNYRVVNQEELKKLSKSKYIEIGSHTVTHPQLSTLDDKNLSYEIAQSKKKLEQIIQKPVLSFSYPYGGLTDIGENTPRIVEKSGFRCAVANFPNLVGRKKNKFLLPRYLVRNWDEKTFHDKLKSWFK